MGPRSSVKSSRSGSNVQLPRGQQDSLQHTFFVRSAVKTPHFGTEHKLGDTEALATIPRPSDGNDSYALSYLAFYDYGAQFSSIAIHRTSPQGEAPEQCSEAE